MISHHYKMGTSKFGMGYHDSGFRYWPDDDPRLINQGSQMVIPSLLPYPSSIDGCSTCKVLLEDQRSISNYKLLHHRCRNITNDRLARLISQKAGSRTDDHILLGYGYWLYHYIGTITVLYIKSLPLTMAQELYATPFLSFYPIFSDTYSLTYDFTISPIIISRLVFLSLPNISKSIVVSASTDGL